MTILLALTANVAAVVTRNDRNDQVVQAGAPSSQRFEEEVFVVDLPSGWTRIRQHSDGGSRFFSYGDGAKRRFTIEVDNDEFGVDFETDLRWDTEFADPARTRFRVVRTQRRLCRPSQAYCLTGNGVLEIVAVGARVRGRPQFNFSYTDATGERARTDLFSDLIAGVRLKEASASATPS